MSDLAIEATGLGKRYVLGENTSRDRFRLALRSLLPNRPLGGEKALWALRDVSFSVTQGEAIGIIGRNGAGKSTLLKLLSRITQPTEGRAQLRGRVGTLLEVGTGFHPELTGRDNIFLSGAILGMPRAEVARKFDEIVAFAEIEKFVDTPVKRYSSGMYVRLAFAVASFLEPEILIVDEVLAVGDVAFQRKSLARLNDASRGHGRTVLFVSHNLQAIRTFCRRTIVLEQGRLIFDGSVEDGIEHYLRALPKEMKLRNVAEKNRANRSSGAAKFVSLKSMDRDGTGTWRHQHGEVVRFQFDYEVREPIRDLGFHFQVRMASTDEIITALYEVVSEMPLTAGRKGRVELSFPRFPMRPVELAIRADLMSLDYRTVYDTVDDNVAMPFLVIGSNNYDRYFRIGLISFDYEFKATEVVGVDASRDRARDEVTK